MYKDAIREYEKVIALDPGFGAAYNNLAYLFAERRINLRKAVELAEKAVELIPDNPCVFDTLGWVYCQSKRYRDAIKNLEIAVKKIQDDPVVFYHLGVAYYKNGNKQKALKTLQYALKIDRDFKDAKKARNLIKKLTR
jgi:tetratricopeptide (TPR) repeat protein